MKCQRCSKTATLHITEVLSEEQFEELHLCEDCAQKYLLEPQSPNGSEVEGLGGGLEQEMSALGQRECPLCGLRFFEFRSTGRLGCPHDYEVFRDELTPLLENIHGEVRHTGKLPRRQPHAHQLRAELGHLRRLLQQAVSRENYEEAARLRDKIRTLEDSESR